LSKVNKVLVAYSYSVASDTRVTNNSSADTVDVRDGTKEIDACWLESFKASTQKSIQDHLNQNHTQFSHVMVTILSVTPLPLKLQCCGHDGS